MGLHTRHVWLVAVLGRQLRVSALKDVPAPTESKEGREVKPNIESVSAEKELKTRIEADFKANISLGDVSITTENSYLSSVETSDTSLIGIIQESIRDQLAKLDVHQLKLTDEARAVLDGSEGWKNFSQRYGEYFVYGFRSRARFSAVCTIKTSSKKSRDEIKTSLEVAAGTAGNLNAALESTREHKNEWVMIDIKVDISGLNNVCNEIHTGDAKSEGDPKAIKTNKVEEVQKMYDNFKKNFKTQPYLALLCHYSALDTTGKIPLPTNQFAHLGSELERIYKSLFTAQIEVATSPMTQAASIGKDIVALCEEVKKLNITNETATKAIESKVRACLNDVDLWRLRCDLIDDSRKLKDNKMTWGNWTEALYRREWPSGVVGVDNDRKYGVLSGEVSHKSEHYQESFSLAHYKAREFVVGAHDKIIIGYKITSC
ncbi:hypothetical protein MMC18_006150 [Xylographa bjoerkii]|nr:hypothetical protein [Xylographa bjoerkii]